MATDTTRKNLVLLFGNGKKGEKYEDHYKIVDHISSGSMGNVDEIRKRKNAVGGSAYPTAEKQLFGFVNISSNKKVPKDVLKMAKERHYACKNIIDERLDGNDYKMFLEELRNEISILRDLDHPNIIKALEVYENPQNIYLVMQHCSGGDLTSRFPYDEKKAAKIVKRLLSAVSHMHENCICHRDIKLENIMFESDHPDAEIKLIDFGLSKRFSPDNPVMRGYAGTFYTIAPEVFSRRFTSKVDVWSIGVIAHILISNSKPFYDANKERMRKLIIRAELRFIDAFKWKQRSSASKDFVSSMIKADPEKRPSAEEAMSHAWFKEQLPPEDKDLVAMSSVQRNIQSYTEVSEFKKLALMIIAHQSTTEEIKILRDAFYAYDTNDDGTISFDEFAVAMKKQNPNSTDEEIRRLFDSVDTTGDDKICYLEFLAATLETHESITERRLADAFDLLDLDSNGCISPLELKKVLGEEYSEVKFEKTFGEGDLNNDGKITFAEFKSAVGDDK